MLRAQHFITWESSEGLTSQTEQGLSNNLVAPFLHFEQAGLDVDVNHLNILERGFVGPGPAPLGPSTHRSWQTESIFHCSIYHHIGIVNKPLFESCTVRGKNDMYWDVKRSQRLYTWYGHNTCPCGENIGQLFCFLQANGTEARTCGKNRLVVHANVGVVKYG